MQNPRPLPDSTSHPPLLEATGAPAGWMGRCWRWLLDLCQRAEERITENFRVPPGGG